MFILQSRKRAFKAAISGFRKSSLTENHVTPGTYDEIVVCYKTVEQIT